MLLEIDIAKPSIKHNLAGEQFELQSELLVVDVVVPSEIVKCFVEIGQCLFKITHQEIGDALLEVCDCQVVVELDGAEVAIDLARVSKSIFLLFHKRTYSFLVLSKRGMYDSHVEQYLRGIGNLAELAKGLVELIVVVVVERGHPRLDFLEVAHVRLWSFLHVALGMVAYLLERHCGVCIARWPGGCGVRLQGAMPSSAVVSSLAFRHGRVIATTRIK